MLKNYIKIAFRNLRKQKLYSLINILGLALGLAFCVLVLLFINDELTYDHFHEDKDRIYRLFREPVVENSPIDRELYMPIPTGPSMKADFPEVEEYVRLTPFGTNVVRHEGQLYDQEDIVFSDPQVFDVFTFPMVAGNAKAALTDPYSTVITEEVARKYFGKTNAVGEVLPIRLNGQFYDFTVTGVARSIPSNSTIQFQVLLPHQTLVNTFDAYGRVENRWDATRLITYVRLQEGANVENVRTGLPQFMQTHMGAIFDEMREQGRLKTEGPSIIYQLQPLLDIHLNPDVPGGFSAPSNPTYSYILGGIALAVLLIACINFMILAIARSAKRAKEVGMRKVAGAQRTQLMTQFWGEALLLCFVAFACGIGLAEMLLPVFNELSGKELSLMNTLSNGLMMPAVLVAIFLLTGFIAGSYPALILSGFPPIESLKEKVALGGSNNFTKSLIVVQFGLSVFLVISTLVMSDQLNFMRDKNLGFQGEQVVVIPINGLDGERTLNLYRDAMQNETGVISISGVNTAFDQGNWRRGFDYQGELKQVAVFRIDPQFIETMRMQIAAGRDFDPARASDSTKSIIVNEAFLQEFGWTENPIGRVLEVDWDGLVNPRVIGVVENFHYRSLRNQVEPAMMYTNSMDPILNLMVRIRPENMSETIDQLRATWNGITNEVPFNYRFLDDGMDQLYQSEEQWSEIVAYGSFFAIFVAGLGLFGLAGIVAVRRQKEIGIRKVLGATVSGIVALLSKDFARLVLIAIVIAAPIAYYVMQQWLQNFAYRIEIGIGVFLLAGFSALAVALATVGWQALKAAFTNPVKV
jgi:putative ABC transport system permease protein